MDTQVFITIIVLVLFALGYYSTNSKRNKILCFYTGKDKTDEEKWVSTKSGYVIFRGGKFDIITRRITSFWMTRGIHMFFPTKVNCIHCSWYSRFPHDPDNYTNVWETPAVRKVINKEEWVKSYAKGFTPPSSRKQGTLVQYLPWIAIVLVVLVGFYLYSNQQVISQQIAEMANQIRSIAQ